MMSEKITEREDKPSEEEKSIEKPASPPKDDAAAAVSAASSANEEKPAANADAEDSNEALKDDSDAGSDAPKEKNFPRKLLEILETPEYEEAMHWDEEGKAFHVIPTRFNKLILPEYFPNTKFGE